MAQVAVVRDREAVLLILQRHSAGSAGIIECMVVELVAAKLDRAHERIAERSGRTEARARVREYLLARIICQHPRPDRVCLAEAGRHYYGT